MAGLLSPDSRFYQSWASAADLVILNLLMILGSLPLFTAGAAFTATTRITAEMVREEETYVWKSWWRAFRENFRLATLVWVPALVLLSGFWLEERWISTMRNSLLVSVFLAFILLGVALIGAFLLWYFPLICHFENNLTTHAANAVRLALGYLPRTLLCLALIFLPALLALLMPQMLNAIGIFMVAIGGSFISYLIALIQKPVLARLS